MMRQTACVVGNSSSGIIEAPTLRIPVLNIGDRQKGRHHCRNVVDCDGTPRDLERAFNQVRSEDFQAMLSQIEPYYGDGHTTGRIKKHLKEMRLGAFRKSLLSR